MKKNYLVQKRNRVENDLEASFSQVLFIYKIYLFLNKLKDTKKLYSNCQKILVVFNR